MARIRTIKPEFWTSEQIMECSPMARLLFIGLWNFCDDRGVHPVAYKTLKAEVFPADDILSSDVERMVSELVSIGLLVVFEAEGRKWWYVTGWRHQLINRPSKSRYPEPPRSAPLPSAAGQGADAHDEISDEVPISDPDFVSHHGALMEDSLSTHGGLIEDSLTEGKGRERKGERRLPFTRFTILNRCYAGRRRLRSPSPRCPDGRCESAAPEAAGASGGRAIRG